MQFIKRHLVASSLAALALVAAGAWVAFGWFGVHTLFIDRAVDEALPEFAAADAPPATPAPTTLPAGTPDGGDEGAPVTDSPTADDPVAADDAPDTPAAEDAPPTTAAPTITVEASGSFRSLNRYTTVGSASVLGDGSGQRFVRFEDFETSNGPDLHVYLVNSSAPGVSEHVDLGELRGNIGSQNYEIPAGLDLAVFDTVVIWCVRFGTGFGEATLEST